MPDRIRKNIGVLVKKLNSPALIDELLTRQVLEIDEYTEVDAAIAEKGAINGGNSVLVRKMMSKSSEEVDIFLDCVELFQGSLGKEFAEKLGRCK